MSRLWRSRHERRAVLSLCFCDASSSRVSTSSPSASSWQSVSADGTIAALKPITKGWSQELTMDLRRWVYFPLAISSKIRFTWNGIDRSLVYELPNRSD